jgi:putative endonuclease
MFTVYSIYNLKHSKLYIGQTQDLADRLVLHQNGAFKHCYTSRFDGEWTLIYQEEVSTRQEAIKREKQLKSYRGREFIKKFIPE